MPEQAITSTSSQAVTPLSTGRLAISSIQHADATRAPPAASGQNACSSATGFAEVFGSALQDHAKNPSRMLGDVSLNETANEMADALCLSSGKPNDVTISKTPIVGAVVSELPSALAAAPRELRPRPPKATSSAIPSDQSAIPPQISAVMLPAPQPPLLSDASVRQAMSSEWGITTFQSDSNALTAKTAPAAQGFATLPPGTAIPGSQPDPNQMRALTASQALLAPNSESPDRTAQLQALPAEQAPSFSVHMPISVDKLLAPEPVDIISRPADQVAPAIMRLSSTEGAHHLTLQLAPIDLGPIGIRIEQPKDGPVTITLAVEHPRTLELLQRDLEHLSQTLDRAGFSSQGRQILLHLAPAPAPITSTNSEAPASQPFAGGMQGESFGHGTHSQPNLDSQHRFRTRGGPASRAEGMQSDIAEGPKMFVVSRFDYRDGLNITA